jgi:hypothetical protein
MGVSYNENRMSSVSTMPDSTTLIGMGMVIESAYSQHSAERQVYAFSALHKHCTVTIKVRYQYKVTPSPLA